MVISSVRNGHSSGPNNLSLSVASSPFTASLKLPETALFGTDGIRGKAGELLNANLAMQVGFWAAQVLKTTAGSGPVIVGQDSRNSSDMLAMALSAGLTSAGLEVWHLGLCPTPCVAHLTKITQAVGGIMISASHNPPEDNGIKFFGSNGTKLSAALQKQIETALRQAEPIAEVFQGWGKHYHRPELVQDYTQALHSSVCNEINLQGMKVVLDLAWGAAANVAPSVFQALGAQVISLHEQPDGDCINVNCGATHLQPLQAAVVEYGADLGFAFDGDADRLMAVDSQGRVVNGDYLLYFWGQTLKNCDQLPDNLIVATVMANLGFERAWEQLGGQMLRTAVGDQHVQAEMWRTGAMLGGEQSGHIICHHYGCTGDGLQTALHISALLRQSGFSLANLVDQSFQTYPQLLHNVRVEDRSRRLNWQQSQPLQNEIEQAQAAMGERGRVLVRASGTEPVIRVMVEAECAQLANHWTTELVSAVEKYIA